MKGKTTTRRPALFPPYTPLTREAASGSRVPPRPVTPHDFPAEPPEAAGSRVGFLSGWAPLGLAFRRVGVA